VRRRLSGIKLIELSSCRDRTLNAVQRIEQYVARAKGAGSEFQQAGARAFAYAIARTEAAALLIESADAQSDRAAVTSAQRWCARELAPLVDADSNHRADSVSLENG
jgi:hypothetical protein